MGGGAFDYVPPQQSVFTDRESERGERGDLKEERTLPSVRTDLLSSI